MRDELIIQAETYDPADYDAGDERLKHPQGQPIANLFVAAAFIQQMFDANNIKCVVMGGFAMLCRGSRRVTNDIDMIVNSTPLKVRHIVEQCSRLRIPNTRMVSGVLKIFVKTGPAERDLGCTESVMVEVDLVFPSSKGTPRASRLPDHIESLHRTVEGYEYTFYALDIFYMLKTKLWHCNGREELRDVRDIQFLFENYEANVRSVAGDLDDDDKEGFMSRREIQEIGEETQSMYRNILRI
ncbi:hypothetical protein EJ05DRAFT_473734 [Pseudovirgaria hyperparasitica]|uniref:Nucleotidyl transferase AbiEii/AbiGii toxin family protein n=1 Tax=Pseudovirgaria hyperparasitica TaxID=470096 RepID=A0A6A6WGJ5_9PEZI|nr:uncharacterized protein EJ05DRAFT_473734 [Pseudovirgaria hyperparasitica]KAF2761194.1 hypothetical protein EJ05DRAFT_473734 [Pseudovirgaria hyperparasitica]